MTRELDGRAAARAVRAQVAESARTLREAGTAPTVAILLATDDGGAQWYSRSIARAAEAEGIDCRLVTLASDASQAQVADALAQLAADDAVHGIILQTPLPPGVSAAEVAALIPPRKDLDGMTALSAGQLVLGQPAFAPATAEATMRLLAAHDVPLAGAEVVVIGRSAVVGKPLAQLLLAADATVTVCHSRTRELATVAARAEVLVVAIGRPRFVGAEHVRPGAIVVDVGTNAEPNGSLVGDVDAAAVDGVAGALSPVPGGVGPLTTATLLHHAVEAAQLAAAAAAR
jgi:methylenetetrahydrofolate dehydrogenase (NADP+) / methenyltetrahydrofolate cyclohydrolase